MSYTQEQFTQAIRKAAAAGDIGAANELAAEADRLFGATAPPSASKDDVFGDFNPADVTPLPQEADDFLIGVGKGAVDVGRGVQDAWHRVTGNEDALTRLTAKAEAEDAQYRRDLADSGWATAGHITGQVAATLPAGGVVAGLGRGAAAAGHTGRLAVAEGALSEGLSQRGNPGERAVAAAGGAVGGAAGDLAVKGVSQAARRLMAKRDSQGIRAAAAARDAEADERVRFARDAGGYTLDRADAALDDLALREREATRIADTSGEFAAFRGQQEADILARASSFIDEEYQRYIGESGAAREDAADRLAGLLASERRADEREVSQAYDAWSKAAGDEPLDVTGLGDRLEGIVAEIPYADRGTREGLRGMLREYGIGTEASAAVFTAGKVERVRKELNAFWQQGRGDANKALSSLKEAIDNHVASQVDTLSVDGARAVELGRQATALARENFKKWDKRTIFAKLTETGPDGDSLRKAPQSTLRHFLNKDQVSDLAALKFHLHTVKDPQAAEVWNSIANVPLLEALDAGLKATGGTSDMLNVTRFKEVINRLTPRQQDTLWGLDGAVEIRRAVAAWELHGRKPAVRGAINNSGTAETLVSLGNMGVRAAGAPGAGTAVLGLLNASKAVQSALRSSLAEVNAQRLANGRLTVDAERRQTAKLKRELLKAYGSPEMLKYDRLFGWMARQLVRESITQEDAL